MQDRWTLNMTQLISSLDNREIAIGLWLIVALLFVLRNSDVRRAFAPVARALTAKPILIGIVLMVGYLTVEVKVLSLVGIWVPSQIKTTIIWAITVATVMLFTANSINEVEGHFCKAAKENFKFSVLVSFFVNLHVLPLIWELIIVPIGALAAAMLAVAEADEKYVPARKLLNGFLGILGMSLLGYALWKSCQNPRSLVEIEALRSLAIPVVLSLLFLPFIYLVVVYMAYENVFVRLKFVIRNKSLNKYAKKCLILHVRLRIPALHLWLKEAWSRELASREDIDKSIQDALFCRNRISNLKGTECLRGLASRKIST